MDGRPSTPREELEALVGRWAEEVMAGVAASWVAPAAVVAEQAAPTPPEHLYRRTPRGK